ncbi:unnamed protein product [Amaranthus hypochondriacus]
MAYKIRVDNRTITTTVVKTIQELDTSLRKLLSTIRNNKNRDLKHIIGIDIQKHFTNFGVSQVNEKVAVISLCFSTHCLIIQLLHLGKPPCSLSEFMQLQDLSFVGVGINHIMDSLRTDYGIKCRNSVDLSQLAADVKNTQVFKSYNLVGLADKLLFLDGNKKKYDAEGFGNWGAAIMSSKQVESATWDAFMCFNVANKLFGGYLPESQEGTSYDYYD